MTRRQRWVSIVAVLVLVALAFVSWRAFRTLWPNAFDVDATDELEVAKLKEADLGKPTIATADWPQFYGPNRDGVVPAAELRADWDKSPPKVLWSVPCGEGYSSFAIVGGTAYTMDKRAGSERVVALDLTSGAERWTYDWPASYERSGMNYMGGPRATPTVHDGKLYAAGATGTFVCLKLPADAKGKPELLWQKDLLAEHGASLPQWGTACSPLIEADVVVLQPGGKKGSVAAYDRSTGELRWATESEPSGYSSPMAGTFGGVRQIVALTAKSLLGIRAADGVLLWKVPFETQYGGNVALPVIAGNYVFASAQYGKGCGCYLVESTAKPVYFRKNAVMRNHHSTSVHRDGLLYGFDDFQLAKVDLRRGTRDDDWLPPDQQSKIKKGSVLLLGDHLLSLGQNGSLHLGKAGKETYEPLGTLDGVLEGQECWALPAYSGGKIVLRDAKKVVCLDVGK